MDAPTTSMIRPATAQDCEQIAAIYNWYIANTTVTFEEEAVSATAMAERLGAGNEHCPWYVLVQDNSVLGYAYAAPWKARSAYRYAREVSIYLAQDATGKGLGRGLFQHLVDELRKTPIHLLIAGIAQPNPASVALHERLGFTYMGTFTEAGFKFARHVDVGYWQLVL